MDALQQHLLDSHRAARRGEPAPPAPGTHDAAVLRDLYDRYRAARALTGPAAPGSPVPGSPVPGSPVSGFPVPGSPVPGRLRTALARAAARLARGRAHRP
ncbi:hypothetical protein ACFY9C_17975 [Streptomyces filamentosus]|uniref:hypothetical protein n=1 Tax=Streptomyces filamentosus TaxID=67294 RepID=UPI0036E70746